MHGLKREAWLRACQDYLKVNASRLIRIGPAEWEDADRTLTSSHLWRKLKRMALPGELRKCCYKIFTARAASSTRIDSEISDCSMVATLAHRESTAVSVGEKAVLVLKAINR